MPKKRYFIVFFTSAFSGGISYGRGYTTTDDGLLFDANNFENQMEKQYKEEGRLNVQVVITSFQETTKASLEKFTDQKFD